MRRNGCAATSRAAYSNSCRCARAASAGANSTWCSPTATTRAPARCAWPKSSAPRSLRRPLTRRSASVLGRSLSGPHRIALVQECANTLLRISRRQVVRHYLGGVRISVRERQFSLTIERLFADREYQRRLGNDSRGKRGGPIRQRGRRCRLVDQSDTNRGFRIDQLAGQQHAHGGLAADIARQGDHGGRAKEPDVDSRRRKASILGGQGKIAGCNQLATGRGRNAMYLSDDRLRQTQDRQHDFGAFGEQCLEVGAAEACIEIG